MWQRKQGHQHHYLDMPTMMHVQHLENTHSGAPHILQISVGHESCPHCGSPHWEGKRRAEEIDPKEEFERAIEMLNESHVNQLAYAARHGLPLRTNLTAKALPPGYTVHREESGSRLIIPHGTITK